MQKLLEKNELGFGCIETWLLLRLTNGNVFAAERSNASSTGMYDSFTVRLPHCDFNCTARLDSSYPVDDQVPNVGASFPHPLGLRRADRHNRRVLLRSIDWNTCSGSIFGILQFSSAGRSTSSHVWSWLLANGRRQPLAWNGSLLRCE